MPILTSVPIPTPFNEINDDGDKQHPSPDGSEKQVGFDMIIPQFLPYINVFGLTPFEEPARS